MLHQQTARFFHSAPPIPNIRAMICVLQLGLLFVQTHATPKVGQYFSGGLLGICTAFLMVTLADNAQIALEHDFAARWRLV